MVQKDVLIQNMSREIRHMCIIGTRKDLDVHHRWRKNRKKSTISSTYLSYFFSSSFFFLVCFLCARFHSRPHCSSVFQLLFSPIIYHPSARIYIYTIQIRFVENVEGLKYLKFALALYVRNVHSQQQQLQPKLDCSSEKLTKWQKFLSVNFVWKWFALLAVSFFLFVFW